MIGKITGTPVHKEANYLIVDVGGVGYKVFVTNDILQTTNVGGSTLSLWTYLAVREDALDLFGFANQEALTFFESLLSVSGIGPRSAITILNVAPVKNLKSAIASGDATHLTKTTGIGTKKAEKIILELRDKLDVLPSDMGDHREMSDSIEALQALGYSRREAQEALKKVTDSFTSTEAKIKEALRLLGK